MAQFGRHFLVTNRRKRVQEHESPPFKENFMALYDDIKAQHKGIADAYQAVVKAAKDHKIDPAGVDAIMAAANIGPMSDIPVRLEALMVIWYDADFTADGLKKWELVVGTAVLGKEGGAKLLKTSADRSEITKALDLAAANVSFVSPKLGVEYNACQYRAIKQLVDDRRIRIIEALKKGLSDNGAAAAYEPAMNLLKLYSVSNHTPAIAHELTHAVQDWNDASGFRQFVEADAWVVTIIVDKAINGPLHKTELFAPMAELIAKKGTKVSNPDWVGSTKKPGVYDKLVAVVAKGLKTPEANVDMINTESGTSEKVVLANLMKKLCATSPALTPAAPKTPAKTTPAPTRR